MHIGIDYGSKLAGTTSICFYSEGELRFLTSRKKQDADQMIHSFLETHEDVDQVFIDAPLSLPSVYSNMDNSAGDYFYRACDRAIKAMSPMFLGGLTARAMKISSSFTYKGLRFFESYPSGLVDEIGIDRTKYKKDKMYIAEISETLLDKFDLSIADLPQSWHEVDAMLAFLIGRRYKDGNVKSVGDPSEGLIYY